MIWDGHLHLTGVPGATPEERMAVLVRAGARMGIERFVVSMGMRFIEDPTPADLRQQNDDLLRALARYPDQTLGIVYLSPRHVETSLAEFERCVRDGPMVGIKLWVAQRATAPGVDPLLERAAQAGVPVYQHTWDKATGNLPGESTPADLAVAARRHPHVSFICGHTGGDWARALPVIRDLPNVWTDLSGSDPTAGYTEAAVRELGAARVLYGSDAGGRSYASQIAKVTGANIGEAARQAILGGNLRALLAPVLRKKGMRA